MVCRSGRYVETFDAASFTGIKSTNNAAMLSESAVETVFEDQPDWNWGPKYRCVVDVSGSAYR
jgi:hypothetical protein